GDDVRVLQLRGGRRFPMEPVDEDGMNGVAQDLEGHCPLQVGIGRLVDDARAPAADFREDIVLPESSRIASGAGAFLGLEELLQPVDRAGTDRKSTRLNSSHANISYAVFCLK